MLKCAGHVHVSVYPGSILCAPHKERENEPVRDCGVINLDYTLTDAIWQNALLDIHWFYLQVIHQLVFLLLSLLTARDIQKCLY